jgi:hypothetical protein
VRKRREVRDERNRDWRRFAGGGVCDGVDSLDTADEAANGGIRIAENVSGLRVDYAEGEGSLPGVWEGAGERSGSGTGSRMS